MLIGLTSISTPGSHDRLNATITCSTIGLVHENVTDVPVATASKTNGATSIAEIG